MTWKGRDMTTFFEEEPRPVMRVPQAGLRTALSIAGLDPSGGAGVIADVRTFDALGVYGMAAVATVTFQNTIGMAGRYDMPAEAVRRQVEEIFRDRLPNAIKTGALGSAAAVKLLARMLHEEYPGPVVVDPIVLSGSGARLLDDEGAKALVEDLIPGSALVTPNVSEVEFLSGFEVFDIKDVEAAALRLIALGARSALVTGKKVEEDGELMSADVFCDGEQIKTYTSPWIQGIEIHGSGCLLSSAITACLAKGMTLKDSVEQGRALVRSAMEVPVFPGRGASCADPFSLSLHAGERGPAPAAGEIAESE